MNIDKLLEAQATFLQRYPGGFEHEDLRETLRKKHNVNKLSEFAASTLAKKSFSNQGQVLEDITKIVTRSSMISMFEKPKFRDFVKAMNRGDRELLAQAFYNLIHGKRERGFNDALDILREGKLAKWSLISICPHHYRPQKDVFVKPTTTKNVIRQFELDELVYNPKPTWAFYVGYRDAINEMKALLDPCLSPNNAAFTGFLMMTTAVDK